MLQLVFAITGYESPSTIFIQDKIKIRFTRGERSKIVYSDSALGSSSIKSWPRVMT